MCFLLPGSTIPGWFQHCCSGPPISFSFRNMSPILLCVVFRVLNDHNIAFDLWPIMKIIGNPLNEWLLTDEGYWSARGLNADHIFSNLVNKWLLPDGGYWSAPGLNADHIFIFDEKQMKFKGNVNKVLLENNEWNHVEISINTCSMGEAACIDLLTQTTSTGTFRGKCVYGISFSVVLYILLL